jgi:hypothetical protein
MSELIKPPSSEILSLLTPATFIPVHSGTKHPKVKWKEFTHADSEKLKDTFTENIAVKVGEPSFGLCSIDLDSDQARRRFLQLNPRLENTLHTWADRGGNIWVRISSGFVPQVGFITLRSSGGHESVGEWRSTGGYTLVHGIHPEKKIYQNNGKEVISLKLEEIVWPSEWETPWEFAERKAKEPKKEPEEPKSPEAVRALLLSIPDRPDYHLWMRLSAAVRNSLANESDAIAILKEWSPEEEEGEYERLLQSDFDQIGFGTLFHYARKHGFKGIVNQFFYDGGSYGMDSGKKEFIPLRGEDVARHLFTRLGVPRKGDAKDQILCDIQTERFIEYLGPVAGYRPGFYEEGGRKFVVTSGPKIIPSKKGESPFLDQFFLNLLGGEGIQHETFLDWLAHARKTLLSGVRGQTPALALCGDRGHGKSLAISIINKALGGRTADCYKAFSGQTRFNGDLLGAELLVMDDSPASTDYRSRSTMAQNIKGYLFKGEVGFESKGRNGVNFKPIQAVVIAVNRSAEHLRVLPNLEDSMDDKISLLVTTSGRIPSDIQGKPEALSKIVDKELPGFLYALEQRIPVTEGGRLKCFQNPVILDDLNILSNEYQLLALIREAVVVDPSTFAKPVTANQVTDYLTSQYANHTARYLLRCPNVCGQYLSTLAKDPASGVEKLQTRHGTGVTQYQIHPPPRGEISITESHTESHRII